MYTKREKIKQEIKKYFKAPEVKSVLPENTESICDMVFQDDQLD